MIADVAYFGVSKWGTRADRDDVNKTSEVAAFDLRTNTLLWRRTVATRGLLNVVAAPQLSERSTSVALPSWALPDSQPAPASPAAARPQRRRVNDGAQDVDVLDPMPYVPYDPASGSAPRTIALADKLSASRVPAARLPAHLTGGGAFVPLRHVDVAALATALRQHPEIWDAEVAAQRNAILAGRESNMARFKPGCASAHLIFSDQSAEACFEFPWWAEWKHLVQPIISEILSWYGVPEAEREHRAVRLQLARMAPGGSILKHADKGGWATGLHRVHIPVITNPDVEFLMQADASGAFVPIHVAPGDVFEINNVIPHQASKAQRECVCAANACALLARGRAWALTRLRAARGAPAALQVHNSPDEERIHLLLDWSESAIQCGTLNPGQRCQYANQAGIKCL